MSLFQNHYCLISKWCHFIEMDIVVAVAIFFYWRTKTCGPFENDAEWTKFVEKHQLLRYVCVLNKKNTNLWLVMFESLRCVKSKTQSIILLPFLAAAPYFRRFCVSHFVGFPFTWQHYWYFWSKNVFALSQLLV